MPRAEVFGARGSFKGWSGAAAEAADVRHNQRGGALPDNVADAGDDPGANASDGGGAYGRRGNTVDMRVGGHTNA
jgi:hypothetical protein